MINKQNVIYIIGPMGSGKSSVGKCLAQRILYTFYDLDEIIVKNSGVDISWIFEQEGEVGFRLRETKALKEVSTYKNVVIATGGGCVISTENRKILKAHGFVVYLKVSIEKQISRIAHTASLRPVFAKNTSKESLTTLNQQREPFYLQIADLSLETDSSTPTQLAEIIYAKYTHLKQQGK